MIAALSLNAKADYDSPKKYDDSSYKEDYSHKKVSSLLYSCNLSFQASGPGTFIVSGAPLNGTGLITCYDFLTGATEKINLKVKAKGLRIGIEGRVSISGGALGIGLTTGPESLLGTYGVVRAGGAVGVGVGAATGLRLSKGAVTINAAINAQTGLGASVDLLALELEADGRKQVENRTEVASAVPTPIQIAGANSVQAVPVETAYVSENQPVVFVDAQGRTIKIVYLKPTESRH